MELTDELKSTVLHFLAGILMGFISFKLGRNAGIAVSILAAFALSKLTLIAFKSKEKKWWLGNGLWPYLTSWIASWTIFINM